MKKRLRLTYRGHEYHDPMYKQLQRYEDALESGEWVRLPCKVGDTVYGVGFYDCEESHTDDALLQAKIHGCCTGRNGICDGCEYARPDIREFICTEMQIASDGIWIEGYPASDIFTDKAQAEAKLKELEKKVWKTINKINL